MPAAVKGRADQRGVKRLARAHRNLIFASLRQLLQQNGAVNPVELHKQGGKIVQIVARCPDRIGKSALEYHGGHPAVMVKVQRIKHAAFDLKARMGFAFKKLAINGVEIDAGLDTEGGDSVRQRRRIGKTEAPCVGRHRDIQRFHRAGIRLGAERLSQRPNHFARRRSRRLQPRFTRVAGV